MLVKNIYLLYPAGYSGNYVNWAICRSDHDLSRITVTDPLNTTNSRQLGSAGTAHHHHRLPTHMAIPDLLIWIAKNRPQTPQTYVVFTTDLSLAHTIDSICRIDPDPVFIVIHDDNDLDIRIYGHLNAMLKWPTYFHMRQELSNFEAKILNSGTITDFDFFSAGDRREIRNAIAQNQIPWLVHLCPLDQDSSKRCRADIQKTKLWFDIRHSLQPHELPVNMHLVRDDLPYDSIFQLSCRDVASMAFIDFIKDFLTRSGCSDGWSVDPVCEYHQNYINAQVNLAWFQAMETWKHQESAELTEFLISNQVVEGFVIREILHRVGYHSDPKVVLDGWQNQDLRTINDRYIQIQRSTWPQSLV